MENSEKRKKGLDIININDRIETESNERAGRTGRKKEKMNEPTINQPTAEQAPTQPAPAQPAPAPAYDEATDLQAAISALAEAQEAVENAYSDAKDAADAADEAGRGSDAAEDLLSDMQSQLRERQSAAEDAAEAADDAKAHAEKADEELRKAFTIFGAYTAKRHLGATPEEAMAYATKIAGVPQTPSEYGGGYFPAIEAQIHKAQESADSAESAKNEAEENRDTVTDDYDELGGALSGISY